jgi:phosphatidylcholine synthase
MNFKKLLAWCVHLYTTLGLVTAAISVVYIIHGSEDNLRSAIILMLVALVIDASDGFFARLVNVKTVLPLFDGRRLDDIVDFNTYTTIPLLFIWQSDLLPGDLAWALLLPLLASAYGFSQVHAKTDDGYFLGFPSYWNVVAFYLFFLQPEPWISTGIIVLFAVLTFVPAKYLYPSMPGRLSFITIILGVVWVFIVFAIVIRMVDAYTWTMISLVYPVYYMAASWAITIKHRKSTISITK